MNIQFPIVVILFLGISTKLFTQTYVGEVIYRDAYEYIKLDYSDRGYSFKLPYIDGDISYNAKASEHESLIFDAMRQGQKWEFNLEKTDNSLKGTVTTKHGEQSVVFYRQTEPIESSRQLQYIGVYKDTENRRVIVYKTNGYLHVISPFSEKTMSLKPIGESRFWSISGEYWHFTDANDNNYQLLTHIDRFGKAIKLYKTVDFDIKELWIPINDDTLYSKLYLPKTSKKVPGCLILPGGGAIGISNYEYEARFLASHGIASLVFDKSGVGKSKGLGNFQNQTFEQKNEQYKQLFKYLQNHPNVASEKVGVHGPSEGGRIALMMAMDLQNIAFVNATAAPIMSLREGQLYAMDHYHRNIGLKEQDILSVRMVWNAYYDGIEKAEIDPDIIDEANNLRGLSQNMFLPPNSTRIPMAPKKEDLINDRMRSGIAKISCPVLLQYGADDIRVNPYKSAANFYNKKNDQLKLRTIYYKRGNHSFMTPEFEICTGYLDDKIAWLKEIGIIKL